MSFWNLSDDSVATETTTYEAPQGGGDYIFADGSKVMAVIEEMKWDNYNGGEEFINIRWSVMAPETDAEGVKIANRKLFQKLYTNGDAARNTDEAKRNKKADNAKRMLAAIATNAGGGLFRIPAGQAPTNDDFATHMLMKPMTITLKTWEMKADDGTMRQGNWICAVGPVGAVNSPAAPKPSPAAKAQRQVASSQMDDDIPF